MATKEKSKFRVDIYSLWNTETGSYSQFENSYFTQATSEKGAINNIKWRNRNLYGFNSWYECAEQNFYYSAVRI